MFLGTETLRRSRRHAEDFGDVGVATFDNPAGENGPTIQDGKSFAAQRRRQRGSSAPNLFGQFNDKTAIEADRTGGPCDGNVYFATRASPATVVCGIQFVRSTDHGRRSATR